MNIELGNLVISVVITGLLIYLFGLFIYTVLNNPPFKRLIGIDVYQPTEEEKKALESKLNSLADDFVEEYRGETYELVLDLDYLGLHGYDEGVEEVLEELELHEAVYSIEVSDVFLIIEFDSYYLKEKFEQQIKEWEEQGQQDRADYWRDRGFI